MALLLETVEQETGPQPQWSVLWLHGLGADGNDFAPIVPELLVRDGRRRDWPALRFVFPHAPVRAVTINGGARMRAWYDIRDMDLSNRADHEGVAESVVQVDALIAREGERGVPAERVLLIGFSQGGAITLAAGLARKTPAGRPGRVVQLLYRCRLNVRPLRCNRARLRNPCSWPMASSIQWCRMPVAS